MNNKEFITPFGVFTSIVVTVIGVGIFSYPRDVTSVVGTDGWLVTIIAGIVTCLLLYIAYRAVKLNNYNKLYNMLENNFGKILGKILALLFIASNILAISLGMRLFVEVIKMYLLQETPTEFIIIVIILTGSYLVRGEIDALVKFNEIGFWIMFLPIVVILLLTFNRTDFTNVLPVFDNNTVNYIKGLKTAAYSFGGIEIIYVMLPFLTNKKRISNIILKSVSFITIFYVAIIIFTLAMFGKEQNKILLWPTITMIKSIDIPGSFIERWEGIVMALWIVFYFTTFTNIYYLSADIVKDMFNLKDIKISSIIIIPFVYAVALYPENIAQLYYINNTITPIFLTFSLLAVPLMLFFGKKLRQKRRQEEVQ